MDRLEAMRVFVRVAEHQSFVAAARALSMSAAQVTRAVAGVEQRCNAQLLQRTTRTVRVTEAGAAYLQRCKRILAEIEDAEAEAGTTQRTLRGTLTVTAPMLFGRMHVAPLAFDFLAQHPALAMRLAFSDRVIDMFAQNVDVAVRIAALPDSSMHAIKVGSVRRVVCAAPSYLRAHGTPKHPRELEQHQLVAFSGLGEPQAWGFWLEGKLQQTRVVPRLVVNRGDLAIAAAVAGRGLTKVLSYQVSRELAHKRLRVVLAEFEGPEIPVQIVTTEGRRASARVRGFVDYAVDRLRATLS